MQWCRIARLGALALGLASVVEVSGWTVPRVEVSTVVSGNHTLTASAPALALGSGPRDWWQENGPTVVEALGCFLNGAAVARLALGGLTGVGGFLAAAALIEGALGCLT
jgi:hypothetical protein